MIVDCSTYQGLIAWNRVHGAGVTLAMIRGPIGAYGVDDRFAFNWLNAKVAGIPRRGIYADVVAGQPAAAQVATTISHLAALITDLTTHGLIGA